MIPPDTQYISTLDGVRIAYQRFGRGEADLVFVPGWVSHVELNWKEPSYAAFLERLADFSRVTIIDKRGTGCSQRVEHIPNLETRMDDVLAVLDAERIERALLFGESSGAAICALFAATHPERTRALVLSGASARTRWAPDYPWGMRPEQYAQELASIRAGWDSGEFVRSFAVPIFAPTRAGDEPFVRRFTEYHWNSCSRDDAVALSEMWWEIDYRPVLASISVPALVISSPEAEEEAAYLSRRIPGAAQHSVPFSGGEMWVPGSDAVTSAIRDFAAAVADEEADSRRVLATVLFTDIVDSTAHAARLGDRRWEVIRREHDEIVTSHLARYRGRAVKTTGDGFVATFDGPARGIRASLALAKAVQRLDIEVRAGLHTGEVELDDGDIHGLTVAIAARVAATASSSEVMVSQTMRDLVAGSGLAFEDAGEHVLKGVPGAWRLYRAGDPE